MIHGAEIQPSPLPACAGSVCRHFSSTERSVLSACLSGCQNILGYDGGPNQAGTGVAVHEGEMNGRCKYTLPPKPRETNRSGNHCFIEI